MGSIVAPLLAGFGLALIGLILQGTSSLRWPDLALLLLATSTVLLLLVVQFTFRARQYVVTPSEAKDWWPDFDTDPERREKVYEELHTYRLCYAFWIRRARRCYNTAIVVLLLGLAVALFPAPTPGHQGIPTPLRLGAIVAVLGGMIVELALLAAGWLLAPGTTRLNHLPSWAAKTAWWLASGDPTVEPKDQHE